MTQTAHLTYAVEPRGSGWAVVYQGVACGAYDCRLDALRSAIHDASFARHLGHDVKVRAQRRTGSYRAIAVPAWHEACRHPYPREVDDDPVARLRRQQRPPQPAFRPGADPGRSGPPEDPGRRTQPQPGPAGGSGTSPARVDDGETNDGRSRS
jgi:hypothetical protein